MSILEKIVRTESEVQTKIKNAEKQANKMISNAREKSLAKAEEIRLETNELINQINIKLETDQKVINEKLKVEVNKQKDEINELVKNKTDSIVAAMFKEVIK